MTRVHDPCIAKHGEYYYVFSTGRGLPILRSSDLVTWERIGRVFEDLPAWGREEVPGVKDFWAPDISLHDGEYRLYYALSTFGSRTSRIGLATNRTLDPNDPAYKWIDRGMVIASSDADNWNAIDPNVIKDAAGKLWLAFGSFWEGIKLVELDPATGKPHDGHELLPLARRADTGAVEAPFIVKKDDHYFLFVSFDYCCRGAKSDYKIMFGRAEEVTGPYYDRDGRNMLEGGGTRLLSSDGRWRGPGHCSVLEENGSYWLVHHAYDAENNGIPTLRVRPLDWDANGWPVAGEPVNQ